MISFDRVFREKRSLILPLLIALAVNAGLLVLAVLPLTQNVASEETRAEEAAREREDAQQTFARAEAIVNGKARADSELTRFYGQVLPPNRSGARTIAYLNLQQLAQKAGLKFSGQSTPEPSEPDMPTGLTKYTADLTLSGSYRSIRQFIYAIETQPAFLVIERVDLGSSQGQGESLQVTLTIATYYRTADGS